jgi:gluconokinase
LVLILMGVTGAGKTTVGTLLAQRLKWQFVDADAFHSAASIAKMKSGIALTDADRAPWLAALRAAIAQWIADSQSTVLACSALKRRYRKTLAVSPDVRFVYLKADQPGIADRLRQREGHFATEELLSSQFAVLEEPVNGLTVDALQPPEAIVAEIVTSIAPEVASQSKPGTC